MLVMSNKNVDINYIKSILEYLSQNECITKEEFTTNFSITSNLYEIIIHFLLDNGFLINKEEIGKNLASSFNCKFCPFTEKCSENSSKYYYQLTQKSQDIIIGTI
jgi:hypothetical protein